MAAPKLVESHPVVLLDGRKCRILAYDDGSVRFRLQDDRQYWVEELFIAGEHKILKLVPRGPDKFTFADVEIQLSTEEEAERAAAQERI